MTDYCGCGSCSTTYNSCEEAGFYTSPPSADAITVPTCIVSNPCSKTDCYAYAGATCADIYTLPPGGCLAPNIIVPHYIPEGTITANLHIVGSGGITCDNCEYPPPPTQTSPVGPGGSNQYTG